MLDGTINSIFTICLNIYQCFLFCAMKFHAIVKTMPKNNNSKFFMDVIGDVIGYMWVSIKTRIILIEEQGSNCPINELKVNWLGLKAFEQILFRKQTKYREILSTLRGILQQKIFKNVSEELSEVIDEKYHKSLLHIKF